MINPYQSPNSLAFDSGRHRWWMVWDAVLAVAGAVCVLFAFDFPSLQFGASELFTGLIAAAFLAPLLLLGCGFQHAFLTIYRWWKRGSFKQV